MHLQQTAGISVPKNRGGASHLAGAVHCHILKSTLADGVGDTNLPDPLLLLLLSLLSLLSLLLPPPYLQVPFTITPGSEQIRATIARDGLMEVFTKVRGGCARRTGLELRD
jgi:hypothetical protein